MKLVTAPSAETGEAEYWMGAVERFEEDFGFILYNEGKQPLMQFVYADESQASDAHAHMLKALRNCVGMAPGF